LGSGASRPSARDSELFWFLSAAVLSDSKSLSDEEFIGQSLAADCAEFTLSRCSFLVNRGPDAVSVSNAPLRAPDCVFRSNSGGPVHMSGAKLAVFARCLFSALSAVSLSRLEVSGSLFRGSFDAAVSAARCGRIFVTNTNFSENGDGFVTMSSAVEMDRSHFAGNHGASFDGVDVSGKFRSCGLLDCPTAASFVGEVEFNDCGIAGEIASPGVVRKIHCRERLQVLDVPPKNWRYARPPRKRPCSSCQARRAREKQSRAMKVNGARTADAGAWSSSVMTGYVGGIAWLVVVLKLFSDQANKEAQAPNAVKDNSLRVETNFEQLERENTGFPT
jgi:hypothetical protein